MQVSEIMSSEVTAATAEDSLCTVAETMARIGSGALPVLEAGAIVGMITDRDIVVRAIAKRLDPATAKVRDVMSADVTCCFFDDEVTSVAQEMANLRVRRLPVLDNEKHLVGMISLGDIAENADSRYSGTALQEISR